MGRVRGQKRVQLVEGLSSLTPPLGKDWWGLLFSNVLWFFGVEGALLRHRKPTGSGVIAHSFGIENPQVRVHFAYVSNVLLHI